MIRQALYLSYIPTYLCTYLHANLPITFSHGWWHHGLTSTQFVVKPEGGQQCIFDVFLTKPVGVNENLGGREAPEGG